MHSHAMNALDHSPRTLMACIGDASRFRLVQALCGGARCVTDLAIEVGLSQSCTTRHLQALERRHVVCGVRDGKRVMYHLCGEEPALGPLLAWALSPDGAGAQFPQDQPAAVEKRRATTLNGPRVGASRSSAPKSMGRARGAVRPAGGGDPSRGPSPPAPPLGAAGIAVTTGELAGGDSGMGPGPGAAEPARPPRAPRHELEDYLL
jgi:ArsR family transcriptional regulator